MKWRRYPRAKPVALGAQQASPAALQAERHSPTGIARGTLPLRGHWIAVTPLFISVSAPAFHCARKPLPLHSQGLLCPMIAGLLVAPNGTIVSRETLVSGGTNRPHTLVVADLLVTTWDENSTARLRVDRIQ